MKIKLYYIMRILPLLFLPTLYGFNLNNLNHISRKEILGSISKFMLLPALIKENSNTVKTNIYNEVNNNENRNEPMIIESYNNNIFFYSDIDKVTSFELEKKLIFLDNHISEGPINLHIQSNGGSVFHTLYLIDLIKNLNHPVYTYVDGFAASAATLLSLAGEKRFMTKYSLMLIHQLSSGFMGKYAEIKDENDNLDNMMNFIETYYLNNTKINKDVLDNLLKRDLWLNSSTCLKYGLIDEIH